MVYVFTQPNCQPCRLTKLHLKKLGIEYTEAPMDDEVRLRASAAGIMAAPVIEAEGHRPFGGYRPDLIAKLAG